MSSFTRLLLEKGLTYGTSDGALPHRSRARTDEAEEDPRTVPLDKLLEELDQEDRSEPSVSSTAEPEAPAPAAPTQAREGTRETVLESSVNTVNT
ncbi:unnamed protein product [Symbiodinium natans]|uniref:Uncharacterized protein n=1 Tax=Symbiodinium natans TaxID=878477 RepID=A0A812RNK8_9DINO|nr:unnamed protein product [Symbiodinium natans]